MPPFYGNGVGYRSSTMPKTLTYVDGGARSTGLLECLLQTTNQHGAMPIFVLTMIDDVHVYSNLYRSPPWQRSLHHSQWSKHIVCITHGCLVMLYPKI